MLQTFLEIGLTEVSAERPVFINHTRALLMLDPILPADRCVVEILEDVVADAILDAVRRLKSLGYRIALDDLVQTAQSQPLIPFADFIKLDYRALWRPGLRGADRATQRLPRSPARGKAGERGRIPLVPQVGLRTVSRLLPAQAGSAVRTPHPIEPALRAHAAR